MKIALIQINPILGDFAHNLRSILSWMDKARNAGCELVLFPELALSGFPPQDLLEQSAFLKAHAQHLSQLLPQAQDLVCILGALELEPEDKIIYNSALVIEKGQIVHTVRKQRLASCELFDEGKYIRQGGKAGLFALQGLRFNLSIGEAAWMPRQLDATAPTTVCSFSREGADCFIHLAASPYQRGKIAWRRQMFSQWCSREQRPLLFVNQVGAQDSVVFDGHCLVMGANGVAHAEAPGFREAMLVVDSAEWTEGKIEVAEDGIAQVEQALILGLHDYARKSGIAPRAILGLSGGIDSAVTAVLACRALGADNVLGVALPSPYTSQASVDDARQLAQHLGCRFELIPIADIMAAYHACLHPLLAGRPEDTTEQNIQARIRGNLLMALSNKFGGLVLATGNKSELALGYCTLYGDLIGGLAVLADLLKTTVYELARWINRNEQIIPSHTLHRPPSAELKLNQRDRDDLPPYDILDPILRAYVEENESAEEIAASQGLERDFVRAIIHRMHANEYKRIQAPLGIQISSKAFGPGRRYPVTHGFREEAMD